MESDKMKGSMEVLNSFQMTKGMEGLDHASKELYKNKEVPAVILKGVAREFEGYHYKEIMGFIEGDSITTDEDVSFWGSHKGGGQRWKNWEISVIA